MSFYGSVYYQLVDAFYKIVFRNKGKDNTGFVKQEDLIDSENQAIGRKGVFGFSAGNKWINLKTTAEPGTVSEGEYSICEIYHGKPIHIEANDRESNGFKINNFSQDRIDEQDIYQLEPHDVFETCENYYDEAGHITQTEKKLYRLPKSDMDNRVMDLETAVGKYDNSKHTSLPIDKENPDQNNLYNYVNINCSDIDDIQEYMGEWTVSAAKEWSPSWKVLGIGYAPTIAETIGDLDNMYDSHTDRAQNFKSFVEVIGKLPDLYDKLNKKNPINIIDSIIILRRDIDSFYEDFKNGINGLGAQIGTPINQDSIYDHLNVIFNNIKTIEENLEWPTPTELNPEVKSVYDEINIIKTKLGSFLDTNNTTTVSEAIQQVNNRIGTLNGGTEENPTTVASEINRLDNKIGSLEGIPGGITSLKGYIDYHLDDIDEILTNDLGENYAIGEDGIQTNTAFGLIKDNANNISSINEFIGRTLTNGETPNENSLVTKISNLQEFVGGESLSGNEESLKTHIDNIKNYIGYSIPEEGKEIIPITDQINNLGELIGAVSKNINDDSLITRISDLENVMGNIELDETTVTDSIVSLNEIIGTSIDTTDTLYGQINTANASIEKLIGLVGGSELSTGAKTLVTQLSDIHNELYVSDDEKGTTSLTSKVSKCQDFIGVPSEGASTDSLFTQVESIKNDIGILTDVTNSHEFDENVTTDNITDILNNILTRLETLEDDVKNLKTETSPTEPDSENPEVADPIIPDESENGEEGT